MLVRLASRVSLCAERLSDACEAIAGSARTLGPKRHLEVL
jgi:hypothetical protein